MIQQITLKTESEVSLKPLVQSAIQGKLQILTIGINRTRERLAAFEKQYGIMTEEFERRFDGKDLKETLDFIDWSGEIEMLRLLDGKYRALAGVQIS